MSPTHPDLRVKVPASSANLGAGYDLLGLALQLYNTYRFQPAEAFAMQVTGPRATECQFELNNDSLIWQAFARVYQELGQSPPCFALTQEVWIPPSRGLGSSSSAIVAGLLAANRWLGQPLDQQQLLALATELEGHPDNVAPALLGGCILNFPTARTAPHYIALPVPAGLHWGVCIPDFELSTHQARQALPEQVPHRDAVHNMSYVGALIAGFYSGRPEVLAQGLQDVLHQPYRLPLVPGMAEVTAAAQQAGALGCVLSGAGPTLLVVAETPLTQIGQAMQQSWQKQGICSEFVTCHIDQQGAHCLD